MEKIVEILGKRWFGILLAVSAAIALMLLIMWEEPKSSLWADAEPVQTVYEAEAQPISEAADSDFVKVQDYLPEVFVELKYAEADNITGETIYHFDEAYLRYGTVKKLAVALEMVEEHGYTLKIWDAFRPVSAQFDLWAVMPDRRYIADPNRGYSDHSRGNCVDITLVARDGSEIVMPTGFDDFSSRADRNYADVSEEAAENAQLLEAAMLAAGFEPYSAEWWHYTDETDYAVEQAFDPAEAVQSDDNTITISAIGDCILATGYGFAYQDSFEYYVNALGYSWDYFFARVYDVLAGDDLTIANSENVFTTRGERVNKDHQGDEAYWFRSDPSYAQIYTAGSVEAVNVANNHSHDYGEVGFQDSLDALHAENIVTFGYGDIAYYQAKGYSIALLGYNVLGPLEYGVDIEELKQEIRQDMAVVQENADVSIVTFHWGEERSKEANESQIDLAHYTADLGADLILGHHPHVLQEVEQYEDTVIAYSLGNFVYGGARRPQKETMILSVTFDLDPESREVIATAYEEIAVQVYGESDTNNYQPLLA